MITKFNDVEEGAEIPLNSEEVSSEPPTPLPTEENAISIAIAPPTPTSTTDEYIWPSIGDLNNRVRRLISTCQRNFKKEEQKLVQKAKVSKIFKYTIVFRQHSQDLPIKKKYILYRELFYPILNLHNCLKC